MLRSVTSIGQGDGTSGEGPRLASKCCKVTRTYLEWRKLGVGPLLSLPELCDCEEPNTVRFLQFQSGFFYSKLCLVSPVLRRDVMLMSEKF